MAGKITGRDDNGTNWTGTRTGNSIDWESDRGHTGREEVVDTGGGNFKGVSSTDDVVPCDYNGGRWNGRGEGPNGNYEEEED